MYQRMKLYYSFDKKINWHTDYDYIYRMYRASMLSAKKHGHEIYFYGDSDSISKLYGSYDEFVCTDDVQFDLVDDLKIYIHTQEDLDCVTIDGDVFIGRNGLPPMTDSMAWFEYKETKKQEINKKGIPYNGYLPMLDVFDEFNTSDYIEDFIVDNLEACNVGVIKFNDENVKELFINSYFRFKDFFLKNIEPNYNFREQGMIPSLIVCQYYFASLATYYEIDIEFMYNHRRLYPYRHFVGPNKFEDYAKNVIDDILNDNPNPII